MQKSPRPIAIEGIPQCNCHHVVLRSS